MQLIVEVSHRHFIVKRRDTREEVFRGDIREVEDYLDRHEQSLRQMKASEGCRVST